MEEMQRALSHFQSILEEQFKRLETLNKPKKDFAAMDTVTFTFGTMKSLPWMRFLT